MQGDGVSGRQRGELISPVRDSSVPERFWRCAEVVRAHGIEALCGHTYVASRHVSGRGWRERMRMHAFMRLGASEQPAHATQ